MPGFTGTLACTETMAASPRDPGTHSRTCSNFRNKNHSLSRFSICCQGMNSYPSLVSVKLTKYLYPTGKSFYKQHLSQSTGIISGLQTCCGFTPTPSAISECTHPITHTAVTCTHSTAALGGKTERQRLQAVDFFHPKDEFGPVYCRN